MGKITDKTIIRSFIWKLLERCSVQGVTFIISIVLARLLLPSEYGLIAIVLVFTSLANVIIEGGFSTALIQKKEADNLDFSTAFIFSFIISVILYIILFIGASFIANFYNQQNLILIIRIISISLLFGSVNSIQRAYVSKHMLFNKLFKCSLISVIISGGVGILMAYKGFGVWALVSQYMLSQIVNTLILCVLLPWKPALSFSKERFHSLFDFGWKIFASNMMVSLFVNIRSLLIGKLFTPSALAYFDKGKQFPSIIMDNINSSIQTILLPVLSDKQDDRTKVKSMLRRSIKMSSLFIFPLLIGLIVCANPLVETLLTENWIHTVEFIQIFSIAYLFMPIQIANVEAIKALGYSSITLKLESYKKIIEIVILVISLFYGVIWIAWGVVVYNAICMFINLYPCKKLLGYSYKEQLMDILPTFVIACIMGGCIYCISLLPFFRCSPLILIICQIISAAPIYALICFVAKLESFTYLIKKLRLSNKQIEI